MKHSVDVAHSLVIVLLFVLGGAVSGGEQELPAFPGAEGFGAGATGGRGGKVLHVTTLRDYGGREEPIEGSLRWALAEVKGPRIVVFDVGGVIDLKGPLTVPSRRFKDRNPEDYGDYTIAGQTAPGGITLMGGFSPSAFTYWNDQWTANFIIRHIRVRGTNHEGDGLGLYHASNCILDHVSLSEGGDELIDASGATDYTVQWTTAEESCWGDQGVRKSGSGSLNHNYGPFQAYNTEAKSNFHHVLFAHHARRAPYIHAIGKKSTSMQFDIRNCVIYNCLGGTRIQGPIPANVINNVYIIGPRDKGGGQLNGPDDVDYYSGNTKYPRTGKPFVFKNGGGRKEPWPWISVTTETADEALESVLGRAGAWPRDATTRRTVKEVRTRTGKRTSHGPIELLTERRNGPTSAKHDTDRDGMPDTWEKARGLDPDDPKDGNRIVPAGASPDDRHEGYTYVEYYLNELADQIVGKPSGRTYTIKTAVSPADAGVINAPRAPRRHQSYNMPYVFGIIEWGEQEYTEGSTVIMRAKPKPGYVFSRWEGEPADELTARRICFPAKSDVSITAHFEPANTERYEIGVSVSPAKGGNVAGKGAYRKGEIVTLAAYSNKGYEFKKWKEGPLDKATNPVIQFPATRNLAITAEFEAGEGGDVLIDDFDDQDRDSLLKGSSGKPKRWSSKRTRFVKISEGNYAITGGYNAFSLGGKDGRGTFKIPEGTTVLRFRIYNIGKENAADISQLSPYSLARRAARLRWNRGRVVMWASPPLRFPVIPPGGSAVMEIPLALVKNHKRTYAARPGQEWRNLFTFYYFTGYYPDYKAPLWNAHIAVDNLAFGRASARRISAPNLPPVANAGRDQTAKDIDGDGKELVWLDGYDSYDQDGGLITSWRWAENGRDVATGLAPGVELPVGEHTLTLTVKDGPGSRHEDTVRIVVLPAD
jgi:hypothetical protein